MQKRLTCRIQQGVHAKVFNLHSTGCIQQGVHAKVFNLQFNNLEWC